MQQQQSHSSPSSDEDIYRLLETVKQRGYNSAPPPDVLSGKISELSKHPSSISLLDLPYDVLAIILEYIPPYEIPRMRRCSKAFNQFLTADHVLSPLLRHHFPFHVRSSLRGGQIAYKNAAPSGDGSEDLSMAAEARNEEDQVIAGAAKAFDLALKRFFNRTKGKPTSITVINGVRLDACYETETSYDHMFLVFHHVSGCVFIYDSGNRFPGRPYVALDIRSLGTPWRGVQAHRRNVRQSVVLDKRILIVSGTKDFGSDQERRIPQAVYSLQNYPNVEFIGIWRGVPYQECLNNLCANDEWIGCRINRHFVKLIKIDSLRSDREILPDGSFEQGPSPNPTELTFQPPAKGYIKDVHLTKNHVFVYSVVSDENDMNEHGQVDVFRINEIPEENRARPIYEIAHVRSVILHAWQGMFMEYIGYTNPEEVPAAMRCQRWDKIYPHMRGNRHDGLPEEDDESVVMTLGKTFRTNGNVPIGCVRIFAEPDGDKTGPPVLETLGPQNIIPFCVALEHTIQEEEADYTLLLPNNRDMMSRAELESAAAEFSEPNPFAPDVPTAPDDIQMNRGDTQDPQPGDDAAYILHFQNGALTENAKRSEPKLPTPNVREAWYLEQDQTQRSSIITEDGLFHIFYDEPKAETVALNLVNPNPAAQNLKDPIRLFPSHLQHITLEDIFDDKIPFYEISGEDEDEEPWVEEPLQGTPERTAQEIEAQLAKKKSKLQQLMGNIRGGWSCYVWSAETWNGFLITTAEEAKMVILRYD